MIYLRQSTASQEVPLGPFLDSADGNSTEGGLTIANTDIKLWVTGATTLANKNSGGATHISNGIYYAVLDATDTATLGPLVIFVHVAGALAIRVPCVVLDEAVYDVMFGTVAPATISNITGGTITTVTTLTNDPTGVGTLLTRMGTPSNLGSGATVAANLSDIEGFADDIPSLPTAAAIADAVWDEDATAHQTQGTFGQAIGDPAADANTIYGAVVTGAAGATIAADIIDVEGKVDDLETRLGTPSDLGSGATVAANLVDIEAQTDDIAGLSIPTAGAIADAVWDEPTTGHITAGTFGEQVKTDIDAILVDTATLPADPADASDIAAAFVTVNGKLDTIDTNVDAILVDTGTTLQAELDGIQADTEDIQSRLPAALVSGRIDASVGAMATDTLTAAALAADAVTEIQANLSTLTAAQVNAEVVDALTVDVIADSTPALGNRPTIAQGVLMLTRFNNDREVAGTIASVKKEDGGTEAYELTLGDANDPATVHRTG